MISNEIRQELQNIIRGELHQGQSDPCSTIRNLLCKSFGASPTVKSEFESRTVIKEKQVSFLRSHAQKAGLWMKSLPHDSQYLAEGGESKVYLSEAGKSVIKVRPCSVQLIKEIKFAIWLGFKLMLFDRKSPYFGFCQGGKIRIGHLHQIGV